MMIASRLAKSRSEAMTSVTAGEFIDWLQLFKDELEEPGITEFYLMQVSQQLDLIIHILNNMFRDGPAPPFKKKLSDYIIREKIPKLDSED